MIVLAQSGLAGRIIEAGANYSKVMAVIDEGSSTSAMIARSKDMGFVNGDQRLMYRGMCELEFYELEADVVVGDEVVTSDLSDIYPPGVLIGFVDEIHIDMATRKKYAYVSSVVDFSELKFVLVVNELYEEMELTD